MPFGPIEKDVTPFTMKLNGSGAAPLKLCTERYAAEDDTPKPSWLYWPVGVPEIATLEMVKGVPPLLKIPRLFTPGAADDPASRITPDVDQAARWLGDTVPDCRMLMSRCPIR